MDNIEYGYVDLLGEKHTPQGNVLLVDDYGHHPAEIAATMAAARNAFPGRRLVLVFQPHRYTRTAQFKADFARVLAGADEVYLLDVYAAGEAPVGLSLAGLPMRDAALLAWAADIERALRATAD